MCCAVVERPRLAPSAVHFKPSFPRSRQLGHSLSSSAPSDSIPLCTGERVPSQVPDEAFRWLRLGDKGGTTGSLSCDAIAPFLFSPPTTFGATDTALKHGKITSNCTIHLNSEKISSVIHQENSVVHSTGIHSVIQYVAINGTSPQNSSPVRRE